MNPRFKRPEFAPYDPPKVSAYREPHETPVALYVGLRREIDASGREEREGHAERVRSFVPSPCAFTIPQNRYPDFVFIADPQAFRVQIRTIPDMCPVGLVGKTAPYVLPEFRRSGLGSYALFLHDKQFRRMGAMSYSPQGVRNRAAVHAHHVNEALQGGLTVPEDVMSDYVILDGHAKLRMPYTPERHTDLIRRMKLTRESGLYERVTQCMEQDTTANVDALIFKKRITPADTLMFALAAQKCHPESQILRVTSNTREDVFAVSFLKSGLVLDIFGSRNLSAYAEECSVRYGASARQIMRPHKRTISRAALVWSHRADISLINASLCELGLARVQNNPEVQDFSPHSFT